MSKLLDHCLILHPLDNIRDICDHVSLVAYTYEQFEGKIIYIINENFEKLLRTYFSDFESIIFEVIPTLSESEIFKLVLQKYKNIKNRKFFHKYDKYRLDNYKHQFHKINPNVYNPYMLYDYETTILFDYFIVNTNKTSIVSTIQSIANMDYKIMSNIEDIPMEYKKNSSVTIIIDKMFSSSNYFDCFELIRRCKVIYVNDYHEFTYLLYIISKSKYNHLLKHKHITLFYKGLTPCLDEIPSDWKTVNILEDK